jgi:putative ABC transport system permease protein
LDDLKYAIRLLRKSPVFAGLSVTILTLGIALNTAVFSAVNVLVRKPLPFPASERLVLIRERNVKAGATSGVSVPAYLDWRRQSQAFEEMGAVQERDFNLTGAAEPESVHGARASVSFLRTLGLKPVLGRSLLPEEDRPNAPRVALLSEGLWRRRFDARPDILGRQIRLDGESYTVIGVMPRIGRSFYSGCQVWTPLIAEELPPGREDRVLQVVARLKPGEPPARAGAEMATIARRIEQQYPASNTGWSATVLSMNDLSLQGILPGFLVLLAAVALVLMIVCANIANLQLARALARRKEVALRMALGASRGRVVRQMLAEGLLMAAASGGLGLLLTIWVRSILVASVPDLASVRIDAPVLGFTLLVTLLTGLIFGLAPALSASKGDFNETLKAGGRALAAGPGRRLRSALVVSEMAAAVLLLVGAGLLTVSFVKMRQADPGFRTGNILTVGLSLPDSKYSDGKQRAAFYRQAVERLSALPGVGSAAAVSAAPLTGANTRLSVEVEGLQTPTALPAVNHTVATPGYFQTLGIPMLRGRYFTGQDREGAPPVVIVNERAAQLYWPNADPLGKRIRLQGRPWSTVVGVSGDVRQILVTGAAPEVFAPHAQDPSPAMCLVLRTTQDPRSVVSAVRAEIRALDRDLPVASIQTMEDIISGYLPGAMIVGIVAFSGAALLLAALGLFGVISFLAAQRTREIGIRMALGASPQDVRKLVVGQGLRLAAVGAAVGLAGALALSRVLSGVLFGVSPTNPGVFAAVTLILAGVAVAASYFPARRASRIDPMVALRYE